MCDHSVNSKLNDLTPPSFLINFFDSIIDEKNLRLYAIKTFKFFFLTYNFFKETNSFIERHPGFSIRIFFTPYSMTLQVTSKSFSTPTLIIA